MCSKYVETWNKLILKQNFCASSCLISEINILRCTVSKTSKFGCNVTKKIIWNRVLPYFNFFLETRQLKLGHTLHVYDIVALCRVIIRSRSNVTFLLTPRSRVLLEKLTGSQLVKKFPAFYGPRRFITALTTARHLSLSWAEVILIV